MHHKPEGELCTRKILKDIRDVHRLPATERVGSRGRLDAILIVVIYHKQECANRLMHPSQQIEREYAGVLPMKSTIK